MPETINLEPNWEGMRRWVINMAKSDPVKAKEIADAMGREAPELSFCGGCANYTDPTEEHCNYCGFPDGAAMIERGWYRDR